MREFIQSIISTMGSLFGKSSKDPEGPIILDSTVATATATPSTTVPKEAPPSIADFPDLPSPEDSVPLNAADRYQICSSGMNINKNGWTVYRVHNEHELIEYNFGLIFLLRRMMTCTKEEFEYFVVPIIKIMVRYCSILPASEAMHDAEVGGLVTHNLKIALRSLEFLNQSQVAHVDPSVPMASSDDSDKIAAEKQEAQELCASVLTPATPSPATDAAVALDAEVDAEDYSAMQSQDTLGLSLAKHQLEIEEALANLANPTGNCFNKLLFALDPHAEGRQKKGIISALKDWRQRMRVATGDRFTPKQLSFVLQLLIVIYSFAHDMGKILYDCEIASCSGKRYNPDRQTLAQFCEDHECDVLFVRFIKFRGNLHQDQGLGEGLALLGRHMPVAVTNLLSKVQPWVHMLIHPDPAIKRLIAFNDRGIVCDECQIEPLSKLSLSSFINPLIMRLFEVRCADNAEPNTVESDFFCSGTEVVLMTGGRSWALLSLWVNEMEFGDLSEHLDGYTDIVPRLLLTANVSHVLRLNIAFPRYFMVEGTNSLLFVRGIDLHLNSLSFCSNLNITMVTTHQPLLQKILLTLSLKVLDKREAHQKGEADETTSATAAAKTEATPGSQELLGESSTWSADKLQKLKFVVDPALGLALPVTDETPSAAPESATSIAPSSPESATTEEASAPEATPEATAAPAPKKRGRKPKASIAAEAATAETSTSEAITTDAQALEATNEDAPNTEAHADEEAPAPEVTPEASAPKKRGRKPKATLTAEAATTEVSFSEDTEAPAPKKRGRKPKTTIAAAAATAEAATSKATKEALEPEATTEDTSATEANEAPAPKKRGRKPKATLAAEAATAEASTSKATTEPHDAEEAPASEANEAPAPKKRGRKPKATLAAEAATAEVATSELSTSEATETTEAPAPKKRGRKPKAPLTAEAATTEDSSSKATTEAHAAEEAPAPEATSEAPAPKKRGRKPKAPLTAEAATTEDSSSKATTEAHAAEEAPAPEATSEAPAPKKRGRKLKSTLAVKATALASEAITEDASDAEVTPEAPAPKKHGRKPKASIAAETAKAEASTSKATTEAHAAEEAPATEANEAPAPNKRGRKPKATIAVEAATAEVSTSEAITEEAPAHEATTEDNAAGPKQHGRKLRPELIAAVQKALRPLFEEEEEEEMAEELEEEEEVAASVDVDAKAEAQDSGEMGAVDFSAEDIEIMDLSDEEQLQLLTKSTKRRDLMEGRLWEKHLTRFPNKVVIEPYTQAGKTRLHIKLYFASYDQDFKDLFARRTMLRHKAQRLAKQQLIALAAEGKRAGSDSKAKG